MKPTPMQVAIKILALLFIVVPIIIAFFNPKIGIGSFVIGLYLAGKTFRLAQYNEDDELNRRAQQKNNRMKANRGNIIKVQVVDENGVDLPQHIVAQKMKEAQLRAGPRDTVLPIHKVLD
jgi:hypothetical protein